MDALISVTDARNNLSNLINQVSRQKKRVILLRKSKPQAVIIPYDEAQRAEENWQAEFKKLVAEAKPNFNHWLKKQRINKKTLTEEKLYELLDQAAGRS